MKNLIKKILNLLDDALWDYCKRNNLILFCAPSMPDPIDPGESMLDYLKGISDPELQEKLIKAERTYRPQYTTLSLADIERTLFGTDEQKGALDLLGEMQPRLSEMEAESLRSQREADIQAVEELGPRAIQALKESDPEKYELLKEQERILEDQESLLGSQMGSLQDLAKLTQQQVGEAYSETPEERRRAMQAAREGSAARGRAFDQSSIAAEIMNREEEREKDVAVAQQSLGQLLGGYGQLGQSYGQLGQGYGSLFGQYQMASGDPFQAILGRPSNTMGLAQQQQEFGAGQAQAGMGPQLFDPNVGVNLALQQQANQMDYKSAIYGSQMGAIGSAIGAAGSFF